VKRPTNLRAGIRALIVGNKNFIFGRYTMLKKIVCLVIILFGSTSLFAFTAGEKIIYPGFGIGISGGDADAVYGSALGAGLFGDATLFKDAESEMSFAYSIGAMFDYFIIDNLSITTGLSYDKTPYKFKYPRNTALNDLEISMDFAFITIPIGIHYYYDELLLVGGGFYYGIITSDDSEIKAGSYKEDVKLKTNNDLGLFFDLGLNFNVSENGNLLTYIRYKRGITDVYDEEDIITNIKMRSILLNIAYGIKF